MSLPRRAYAGLLVSTLALPFAPRSGWADDPPAPPAERPAEPPAVGPEEKPAEKPPEKKDEKPKFDDTSIFKDYKLAQQKGIQHRRERAAYWKDRTTGKDLYWLGRIWQLAHEFEKSAATFEAYLQWEPPAGDEKAKQTNDKNRENARSILPEVYLHARQFDRAIAAAKDYREKNDSAGATAIAENWTIEGRGHRLLGDAEKALAAFAKGVESKWGKALLDGTSLLLADGKVDEAKAFLAKWPKDEGGAVDMKDKTVGGVAEFVAAVGTPATGLDKAVSIGRAEAPSFTGKPALFYRWNMQTGGADQKLGHLEALRRQFGDKVNVVAFSTYAKWDPYTSKVDDTMTEEKEREHFKEYVNSSQRSIPPCVIAPAEVAESLKLKFDGQAVLIDAEGKLRYTRLNAVDFPYDRWEMEIVLKKAAGG